MPESETCLASEQAFSGRLLRLRVDRVRLDNGRESVREVVEHPGAVAILPVESDGTLVLVRQFRYAVGKMLLEVPAGTREPDESAEACAVRELREETGLAARQVDLLTRFYVSPGWCTEELLVYRARELREVGAEPESDEIMSIERVRPEQGPALIASGDIADAKTLTAILAHLADAG
jgi:8-oxo-dGTP pyrophosphatase MutT (NUDIX family)